MNYISARSAPQMFSLNDRYTLHLICVNGSCNSLANFWFLRTASELIPGPVLVVEFLSKEM